MSNLLIWVLDLSDSSETEYVTLEIFGGRNKYTKKGLFSGPLRKISADAFASDAQMHFLLNLNGVTQVGKGKFKLTKVAAFFFFQHCRQNYSQTFYCRLTDKKLHHVDSFVTDKKECTVSYERSTHTLLYHSFDLESTQESMQTIKSAPESALYLSAEDKVIRGYLMFSYGDVEIPANSTCETVMTQTTVSFRNLQYEKKIQDSLYNIGAKKSVRNEVTFSRKGFLEKTLPLLYTTSLHLFWGHERKEIFKGNISCSISYDMDWFSVSGTVQDAKHSYLLSDLLKSSRGKSYTELDGKVFFIPKELQGISSNQIGSNNIRIDKKNLFAVNQIASRFKIDPSNYLQKFLSYSDCLYTLPLKLERILKPYQKTGVSWIVSLYKNGFGGCLADDMGLGKTVQAIAFIACQERAKTKPVLIVVPRILLYNWQNEINRFAPGQNVSLAYGDFDFSALQETNNIYVTTYDTLVNHQADFCQISFDTLILDETQYVKNQRTNRYQAIKKLCADFVLALTGTPIENNIGELWALVNLLNPGLLGNYTAFIRKYGGQETQKEDIKQLKKILAPFILRRTKEQVLKELPQKEENYVYCEMEEPQRKLYETLLVSVKNEIAQKPSRYIIKDNAVILQGLLYLREASSDPPLLPPTLRSGILHTSCKFELFKDYASRIVQESGKLIVYSQFPRTLNRLKLWCTQKGWRTFLIEGSTRNRQEIIEDFEQSESGVFFISLKAGGIGLNLISCQYIIIYEPWWNSAAEQQAADRIHRIGQKKPVFVYHFLVKDTIEQKIFELQTKKSRLATDVLNGLDSPNKLSMDDICNLLID